MENGGYCCNEKAELPADNCPPPAYNYTPPPQPGAAAQTVTVVVARRPAEKSIAEAYLLWFPLGLLGLHQFYLRRYGFGVLYLFTLGLCGVGWLVDGFRMVCLVKEANRRIENGPTAPDANKKSLVDAYILWFPLGIIGLHHYYLGRIAWGVAYTLTLGLFGIGWLIDACLLPSLVVTANRKLEARQGQPPQDKSLADAYLLGLTPAGLFGAHHFYLGSPGFGSLYLLTLGNGGIGWIIDWFRMPILVQRANNPYKFALGKRHKFLDEAYVAAFPFGFLGLHHFYLERPGWGVLYMFTFGLCGLGWLIDLCRMPCLVASTNERLLYEASVAQQVSTQLGGNIAVSGGGGYIITRPVEVIVYPTPAIGGYYGGMPNNAMGPTVHGGAALPTGETPIIQYPQGAMIPPPYTETHHHTAQPHQYNGPPMNPPAGGQPPNYGSVDAKQ